MKTNRKMSEEMPFPNPGVHEGVGEREYHALDVCSASRLKILHRSTPAHLRYELDNRKRDSGAMRTGRALHALVLEGEKCFAERFHVGAPINKSMLDKVARSEDAEYSTMSKAFLCHEQLVGKPLLRTPDAEDIRAMANAIVASKAAMGLIRMCSRRELTLIGDVHGVRCKGRLDGYCDEGIIVDIKTVGRGAGRVEFERSIGDLGYGISMTMYDHLAVANDLKAGHGSVFIAVESEPPHCVAIYEMRKSDMLLYEQILPTLIERYGACCVTNHWPGWPDEVQEIGLPAYQHDRLDREVNDVQITEGSNV